MMDIKYAHMPDAPPGTPPLAVRAGDLIFSGGQSAVHPEQGIPEEVKLVPGYPFHGSSIERQLRYVYAQLGSAMESLGSSLHHLMKINSYHVKPSEIDMALRLRSLLFDEDNPPASTLVIIPETIAPEATAVLDIVGVAADSKLPREGKSQPSVGRGPLRNLFGWPVYSQAFRGGGLVFTQGTTFGYRDGLPARENFQRSDMPYSQYLMKDYTRLVVEELVGILGNAGCSLEHVVKADIYILDPSDLAAVDEAWEEIFPTDPPARVITPLPIDESIDGKRLEIEFIAVDPQGPFQKETIFTKEAPLPLGPVPQAVKAGPYLFFSTQLATDYEQGIPPEARPDPNFPFNSSSIKRQVEYIYRNVEAICRAAGTRPENLVRRRAAHTDLNEMAAAEEVWYKHLGDRLPPTTFYRAKSPLTVPACTVQYDLTAFITD